MWQGLALLCLLVASVAAAPTVGSLNINSVGSVDVKTWTDWVFIEASVPVEQDTQITWAEVTTTALSFSSTSCTLKPLVRSCSFRVNGNTDGGFQVAFTVSGDNGQFPGGITNQGYSFNKRSISFDAPWSGNNWASTIGLPSEPIKIFIETPSTGDLTLTPTSDDADIQFPANVRIPAGSLSATFTYICVRDKSANINVAWNVAGAEDALYQEGLSGTRSFAVVKRQIFATLNRALVALGNNAQGSLYVYTGVPANDTVTITPQAADTTFTPAQISIPAGSRISASFDYATTTPDNNKIVYFFLSQSTSGHDEYYAQMAPVTLNIPKEDIHVQLSTDVVQTGQTVLSVVLPRPVVSGVTVSWYASNVQFNQSSFEFTGKTTAAVITVNPTNQGLDHISFKITGPDADYYNTISDIETQVRPGQFFGPDSWYIPPLYVGITSDKLPIRASFLPPGGVTLTPSAPDLKFDPASITFTKDDEQHWFTITPQYTANDGNAGYSQTTVRWLVSGTDNTWFVPPSTFSVTIMKRSVQIAWSAHLEDEDYFSANTRHLHKDYQVWATANWVGKDDSFSVTPVSPYFSFSPSTFYFDAKHTRVEFTATVIGVVGSATVDYLLGGKDGGFYSVLSSSAFNTAVRPLEIWQATMAPDTRVRGEVIYSPTASQRVNNHVYDFMLRSAVLPDSELTITPRCNHATFSPKSITFSPGDAVTEIAKGANIQDNSPENVVYNFQLPGLYLEANFTVVAQAAGVHEIWFELSGDDAPYYDVPDHTAFNFRLVTRADEEPEQKDYSAASSFGPSMIAVAVTVVAAMFL